MICARELAQSPDLRRGEARAGLLGIDDGVQATTAREIGGYAPVADSQRHAGCHDERGRGGERHGADVPAALGCVAGAPAIARNDTRRHRFRGRVEHDAVVRSAGDEEATLERDGRGANQAVTAERAPAIGVEKDHADVGALRRGLGQDGTCHVAMPPWLAHQRQANTLEPSPREREPLAHRLAADARRAADDEPQRLPSHVAVDGGNGGRRSWVLHGGYGHCCSVFSLRSASAGLKPRPTDLAAASPVGLHR